MTSGGWRRHRRFGFAADRKQPLHRRNGLPTSRSLRRLRKKILILVEWGPQAGPYPIMISIVVILRQFLERRPSWTLQQSKQLSTAPPRENWGCPIRRLPSRSEKTVSRNLAGTVDCQDGRRVYCVRLGKGADNAAIRSEILSFLRGETRWQCPLRFAGEEYTAGAR